MIDFLLHSIDDYGVPVVAALGIVWNVCRARKQSRKTPWADRIPLVVTIMGLVGILASWIKWVDVGDWPIFLYILGTVSWNGMPNLRDILAQRLDPERRVHQLVRHAVGIRE